MRRGINRLPNNQSIFCLQDHCGGTILRRRDERRSLKKAGSNNKRRLKADLDPRPSQTLIAGPGFQDLKWKHWPASFCRKSKGFMKAQKGRRLLNNGRLNKTPKTPKTNKTSSGGAYRQDTATQVFMRAHPTFHTKRIIRTHRPLGRYSSDYPYLVRVR